MMHLQNLLNITRPESLNFISPFGLGDTMFLAAYTRALENKYDLPVHLIIKPSHELIMKMFSRNDYSVYAFTENELRGIAKNNGVPRPGMLYVAHPVYSDSGGLLEEWNKQAYDVKILWRRFFGLGEQIPEDIPVYYPPVSGNVPDPAGSVLLLPEAHSVYPLKRGHWEKIAASLRKEGLTAVQNYVDPDFCIKDVPRLPDDLCAVIGFALACKKVYSLRSGFCDLIAGKAGDLTVFYTDEFTYRAYPLYPRFPGQKLTMKLINTKLVKSKKKNCPAKKIIQALIKKIPPVCWLLNKLDALEKQLEGKIKQNAAESYNDLLIMARKLWI